jgi:ABC-2 type transport system ATP-binding protein
VIRLNNVEKYYGDRLILNIPQFTIGDGIHWISGVNGSGKTTLLKIISGLIPFDGEVSIHNTSLKNKSVEYRKQISYADAEPMYPSYISGRELVSFFKEIRKAPDENVDELITFSGLRQQLSNPVGTYSSGMVKRLSLILALIGHPPFILLDEPLATLDTEGVNTLPDLINTYRQQYGTTFIFSSHQQLPENIPIDKQYSIREQTIHLSQ